jgi:hypothetical protein
MSNRVQIYLCTSSYFDLPKFAPFIPIQGGAALNEPLPGILGDNSGDNISRLNPMYCEMSAMYWAWKNAPKTDYIGFFHYRRLFNFGSPLAPDAHWSERNFFDFKPETMARFGWDYETILKSIDGADIVMPHIEDVQRPPEWKEPGTLYEHYRNCHISRDINLTMQVIKELYPEYSAITEKVMGSNRGYFCHMYIMRWEYFQEYMQWLFDITMATTNRIDLSAPIYKFNAHERRVSGFIGERIINIWVEQKRHEGAKIMELERLFGHLPKEGFRASTPPTRKKFFVKKLDRAITIRLGDRQFTLGSAT